MERLIVSAKLDHVTITAADFRTAFEFYDAILGALGLVRVTELVDEEEDVAAVEAAAWGPSDGQAFLWLVTGDVPTTGLHVRISAASRVDVEAFYEDGVRSGGTGHAAPRRWTPYRRGEYNAILRDPDGNFVEAVASE